ncbi:uncharacterized protein LOC109728595 [Ananas comosus]|uniref:Uncharacterized protein LOC109728595 n=1 Tax=Ananas comosus TaxID=4615 RepID=A0A199UEP0_ANACO|nr:uncharacterized protein LOC109728595 [Ananas comosus]OAY63199.1 hypothetical protein ACMD2_20594 [Ananas comosus]
MVLTKVLVKVTIERSLLPVHLVVAPEMTAGELIRQAVDAYSKEGTRPLLTTADPKAYDLHYSQYTLQSMYMHHRLLFFSFFFFFFFFF